MPRCRRDYDYLIAKEASRAALVLAVSVGIVSQLPRLVWESGRFRLACVLALCAHSLANLTYTCVQRALCRLLLATGVGVPVPRFDDERKQWFVPGNTDLRPFARWLGA